MSRSPPAMIDPPPQASPPLVSRAAARAARGWARLLSSPQSRFRAIGVTLPWLALVAICAVVLGLWLGFQNAPASPRTGSLYRIVFLHAPAAWVSLGLFILVAVAAGLGLATRWRVFAMLVEAAIPTGAVFSLIAVWTGSLWGRQSWQHWWDVELALELALLLLFVAMTLFRWAIQDPAWVDRVVAVVALLGLAATPVALTSWAHWPLVHRFMRSAQDDPHAASATVLALALTAFGFCCYALLMTLARLRCVVLERERFSDWVERHTGGLR